MKWYKRHCDAALIGMRELTDEEYRAYGVFIDLFYSRNGDVDDAAMLCHLNWNRQRWGRIFKQLENKGKMWKLGEKLVGNRVENELFFYQLVKEKASKNNAKPPVRARVRTQNKNKKRPTAFSYSASSKTNARAASLGASRALAPSPRPDPPPLEPGQVTWEQAEKMRNGRWATAVDHGQKII